MIQRQVLITRYEKLSERAAELETVVTEMATNPRKSISLDTAEGKQSTTYQDPKVLEEWLSKIYDKMEHIARRLGGGTLVNLNMRRSKYLNFYSVN